MHEPSILTSFTRFLFLLLLIPFILHQHLSLFIRSMSHSEFYFNDPLTTHPLIQTVTIQPMIITHVGGIHYHPSSTSCSTSSSIKLLNTT